jgi:hypothetical protein
MWLVGLGRSFVACLSVFGVLCLLSGWPFALVQLRTAETALSITTDPKNAAASPLAATAALASLIEQTGAIVGMVSWSAIPLLIITAAALARNFCTETRQTKAQCIISFCWFLIAVGLMVVAFVAGVRMQENLVLVASTRFANDGGWMGLLASQAIPVFQARSTNQSVSALSLQQAVRADLQSVSPGGAFVGFPRSQIGRLALGVPLGAPSDLQWGVWVPPGVGISHFRPPLAPLVSDNAILAIEDAVKSPIALPIVQNASVVAANGTVQQFGEAATIVGWIIANSPSPPSQSVVLSGCDSVRPLPHPLVVCGVSGMVASLVTSKRPQDTSLAVSALFRAVTQGQQRLAAHLATACGGGQCPTPQETSESSKTILVEITDLREVLTYGRSELSNSLILLLAYVVGWIAVSTLAAVVAAVLACSSDLSSKDVAKLVRFNCRRLCSRSSTQGLQVSPSELALTPVP